MRLIVVLGPLADRNDSVGNPLPFYIPEARKRYRFRVGPPW